MSHLNEKILGAARQSLPRGIEISVLQDGSRVITRKTANKIAVRFAIGVGVGSMNELDGGFPWGTGHYLEHACFNGSNKLKRVGRALKPGEAQLRMNNLNGCKGELDAGTYLNSTIYTGFTCARNAPKALSYFSDIICRPALNEALVESERRPIYEEWVLGEQNPFYLQRLLTTATAYGNHPSMRSVVGNDDSIREINRAHLSAFHEKYRSDNTVVAVVGDINHKDVVRQVENQFDLPQGAEHSPSFPPYVGGSAGFSRNVPGTRVTLGFCCKDSEVSPEAKAAYDVISYFLRNDFSGILNQTLREEKGLVYHTYLEDYRNDNLLKFSYSTSQDVDASLRVISDDLHKLKSHIDLKELNEAKRFIGPDVQENAWRAFSLADNMLKYGKVLKPVDSFKSITPETIQAAIEGMLQSHPTLVCAGDPRRSVPSFEEVKEIFAAPSLT